MTSQQEADRALAEHWAEREQKEREQRQQENDGGPHRGIRPVFKLPDGISAQESQRGEQDGGQQDRPAGPPLAPLSDQEQQAQGRQQRNQQLAHPADSGTRSKDNPKPDVIRQENPRRLSGPVFFQEQERQGDQPDHEALQLGQHGDANDQRLGTNEVVPALVRKDRTFQPAKQTEGYSP